MTEKKYRKKPVEIEAIQWDGTAETATHIVNWILETGNRAARYDQEIKHIPTKGRGLLSTRKWIAIDTPEGTMNALPDDWIIKGIQGEFYPVKPDIFAETYEEVSESDPLTFPSAPLVSVSWDAEEEGVPEGYVHHTYRLPDNGRDVTAKDTANITLIPYAKVQP